MFEEVLGDSFSVFFKNLSRYALLVTVIILPLLILETSLTVAGTGIDSLTQQKETISMLKHMGDPAEMEKYEEKMEVQQPEQSSPFLILLGAIILGIGGILLNPAIVLATDDYYQGNNTGLDSLVKRAARKLPGVIGLAILVGLSCMIGFILLIVPGIILLVKFSLALPIYVLEDVSVFTAISHSFKMTKGNAWNIFGIVLVISIVVSLVGWIASILSVLPVMLTSSIVLYYIGLMIGTLIQMLAGCMVVVVAYLFYAKISGRISTKGKLEPYWEVSQ